jgi:t-SNARE complex subunit (syntaxin)
MQEFFSDIEIVKTNILTIKSATKRIKEINQNVIQATSSESELEYGRELQPLVSSTNKKASLAKQLLQRLKEETDSLKAKSQTKHASEVRIRENLCSTLTRKFVDVMKDYQSVQNKYKTEIKKKVKRQVQIAKPDATSEEIDAVFKAGGGSGDVLRTAIMKGGAADSINNAYMNVADKYADVLALEHSVVELNQMFVDFALLVETQGALLDQIEHNVKEAGEYIDEGNKQLENSVDLMKSVWCMRICIVAIILVVVGIIAALIAAHVNGVM